MSELPAGMYLGLSIELRPATIWLTSMIIYALGLIDEGETVEQAAIRELEEETGFKSDKIIETSDLLVSDPGNAISSNYACPFWR